MTKKLPPIPGGDASAVAGLVRAQRRSGHEVDVLAYRGTDVAEDDHTFLVGPRQTAGQLDRITVRRIVAMRALGRWARDRLPAMRPDVVHAHAVDVGLPVARVARELGIPIVLTCHGVWFTTRAPGSPLARLERSMIRKGKYAAIASVDGASVRALQGAGFSDARLVLNGVDLEEFGGRIAHGGPFRFAFVGRLVRQKGLDVLLRAVAIARGRTTERFTVVLVGDGPQRGALERLAEKLGVADGVSFRGTLPRADLVYTLRTAEAFVLPSRSEGFPIAILEAWAAGTPVVATAVGGIPDLCPPEGAVLVPPLNPDALADAMLSLIGDSVRRESLARAGRRLVEERYTWDVVAKSYEDLYARCLGLGRQGP